MKTLIFFTLILTLFYNTTIQARHVHRERCYSEQGDERCDCDQGDNECASYGSIYEYSYIQDEPSYEGNPKSWPGKNEDSFFDDLTK